MAKFRDFVARQLPVTKVRRGLTAGVAPPPAKVGQFETLKEPDSLP
jgi:hypothetical protein